MLSRRTLLASTAGFTVLAAVGCASLSNPTQIQADIEAIATGLSSLVTALTPFAPASVLAKAQSILDQIKADAALIASAVNPTNSILVDIETAVNALATLTAPFFPMSGAIAAAIQAAIVLINIVMTVSGTTPAPTPAPATAALRKAAVPTMTEAQALATLNGYAKTGIR